MEQGTTGSLVFRDLFASVKAKEIVGRMGMIAYDQRTNALYIHTDEKWVPYERPEEVEQRRQRERPVSMEQGTQDVLAERGGAALDIERLEHLIVALKTAMNCTPGNMVLPERVRLALGGLPDWCVQEMQANARAFLTLTELRLAEGAPGE